VITGPRAEFVAALEALAPAVELRWFGDPAVNVPTAYVNVSGVVPDATQCAHETNMAVLVITQFDDPSLSGPALDAACDLILTALAPLASFVSGDAGTYKDAAASMLLTFATRQ
jgi:hypothetical protein